MLVVWCVAFLICGCFIVCRFDFLVFIVYNSVGML